MAEHNWKPLHYAPDQDKSRWTPMSQHPGFQPVAGAIQHLAVPGLQSVDDVPRRPQPATAGDEIILRALIEHEEEQQDKRKNYQRRRDVLPHERLPGQPGKRRARRRKPRS